MRTRIRLAALVVACAAALALTGAVSPSLTIGRAPESRVRAASKAWGEGRPLTYAVAVEDGVPVTVEGFASEVRAILRDSRSWAAHGDVRLQQVPAEGADFVIRLTTPATTQRLCGGEGYLNCGGPPPFGIVVNLDRWKYGDPDFWPGDLRSYRALLINHEMGHVLGHGHAKCTPGTLAPFMTTLRDSAGCLKTAWPYPEHNSSDTFRL